MRYSVVILNYHRPHNVPIILKGLAQSKRIAEVIVSHGMDLTYTEFRQGGLNVINRKDYISTNAEWGVGRRFVAAVENATTNAIVFVDDDIGVTGATTDALVDHFAQIPKVVHGIHGTGRAYDPETGQYIMKPLAGDVPIVVTQCCAVAKTTLSGLLVWLLAPAQAALLTALRTGHPIKFNGEDIALSLYARQQSGKPNKCWDDLCYTPLSNERAICSMPGHQAHRSAIVRIFLGL